MLDNEKIIRNAYQVAEDQDIAGWIASFTEDGTFTNESVPYTHRGPNELGLTVEVYAKAFPDMHRELHAFYVIGDVVVVQLSLQGTHLGPLELPTGTVPPTGKRIDAPCCDVFELVDGKIKRFDCYAEGSVIAAQLGLV
jgi:ketosteroid isomerase-like protein